MFKSILDISLVVSTSLLSEDIELNISDKLISNAQYTIDANLIWLLQ